MADRCATHAEEDPGTQDPDIWLQAYTFNMAELRTAEAAIGASLRDNDYSLLADFFGQRMDTGHFDAVRTDGIAKGQLAALSCMPREGKPVRLPTPISMDSEFRV